MKKLHSFAFCALLTPIITLGAGSAMAHQSTDQDSAHQRQNMQRDRDDTQDKTKNTQHAMQSDQHKQSEGKYSKDKSAMQHSSYMDSVPFDGMQAGDLIGAEVTTIDDEDIGAVEDLVIDSDGQIVAIVVSVGGFLGMGEKNVAIGWDRVTKTGNAEEQELRVTVSRADLSSAPMFKKRNLITAN